MIESYEAVVRVGSESHTTTEDAESVALNAFNDTVDDCDPWDDEPVGVTDLPDGAVEVHIRFDTNNSIDADDLRDGWDRDDAELVKISNVAVVEV